MKESVIRTLFWWGGWYDIVLGAGFALFGQRIFDLLGDRAAMEVHPVYILLPALYIFIFGLGFLFVAQDPKSHKGIVWLGILMKSVFIALVFGFLFLGNSVPHQGVLMPFALIDIAFLYLFIQADFALKKS